MNIAINRIKKITNYCMISRFIGKIKNNKVWLGLPLIFLALILYFWANNKEGDKHQTLAWINGEPVSITEFKYWMDMDKAEVYNYFYRKYKIRSIDDWEKNYEGRSPLDELKQRVMDDLVRSKVQQLKAQKMGLIQFVSYEDLIHEMDSINSSRKNKVKNGGKVFGPLEYTPHTYYSHFFDRMRDQLKYKLSKSDLKLTNKQLKGLYNQARKKGLETSRSFYRVKGFLQMQYVDRHYEKYVDSLVKDAKIRVDSSVYQSIDMQYIN
jgi:hypothetical protein